MIEYILTEGKEITIKEDEIKYQLSSFNIQNNNIPTKNHSVIKLGACETKLKTIYKI